MLIRDFRTDRFAVGDEVWWHIPTVMDHCRSWAPDITRPTTIIAVREHPCAAPDHVNRSRHTQLVRVQPNYCPWGDEFEGGWLLPVGVRSHNDEAFRAHLETEPAGG